jgi:NtrC-family two-component system sensor histidine kinase KinB
MGNKDSAATRASLELLYEISHELATALDLNTVLRRVLFLSMKNVGAISGSIIVLDDEGNPVESAIITGAQVHDHTTQQLRVTFERGLAGWVAQHKRGALIPDTSQDQRWLRRPDDAVERTGPKSAVSVPIMARDELIGVVTMVHPRPGFFTQDHLELIQAIADQSGIAILNARLYDESQRQARVMTALAESAVAITASLQLTDVLQRILEQISQAFRVEVVSLALIEPSGEELVFRASTGNSEQGVVGIRLKIGQGVAGWVAQHGQGAVVPDVRKDPRFYPAVDHLTGFRTRAIACAPIRSRGKVIGVLEAMNPLDGSFDPDTLLVLTGIGSLAGTAIRHAQLFERLQAAHQRYRDLFEDSIDPMMITDWEGNIQEVNLQMVKITGMDKRSLRRANIANLGVVDVERVGSQFTGLSSGEAISYEINLVAEGGREVPVQVYARIVSIEDSTHLQWILHDITERKNLENLRNDLISMIYHDLRSPLANIVSSLDVIETMLPPESDPTIQSLLNITVRSTDRIQRLTDSLLDMRRLEAGRPIGDCEVVDPAALVDEAYQALAPMIEGKRQSFSLEIEDDLPAICVNADMIRRVLINLLENASKYSPLDSEIYAGARSRDEEVVFWVQDSGPGIPPEDRERIFDKYTRLHSKQGPKGLGLGLAFCKLAVEGHGGRIWVESESDTGSRLKFVLPASPVSKP